MGVGCMCADIHASMHACECVYTARPSSLTAKRHNPPHLVGRRFLERGGSITADVRASHLLSLHHQMCLKVLLQRPAHMASSLAHGKNLVVTEVGVNRLHVQDLQGADLRQNCILHRLSPAMFSLSHVCVCVCVCVCTVSVTVKHSALLLNLEDRALNKFHVLSLLLRK